MRLRSILVSLVFALAAAAVPAQIASRLLLNGVTATGAGAAVQMPLSGAQNLQSALYESYEVTVAGTGALTATVNIEISDDGVNWGPTPLATFTMSCTPPSTSCTQYTTSAASYMYVRGNVTAITGTSAAITARMYP